jgi:hypothetical protein
MFLYNIVHGINVKFNNLPTEEKGIQAQDLL